MESEKNKEKRVTLVSFEEDKQVRDKNQQEKEKPQGFQDNKEKKLNENVYRNDEYHFRIKFPEGWEIVDGDGKHIIKKAVKDNSTILVLVRSYDYFLPEENIRNLELSDFTDKEINQFLDKLIEENINAFPGSTILEKGIRYIDNRKAVYFKMNQVYKVQNIQVEGISENYFTIHKGKLFQVGGFYPTVPIDEHEKESIINQSIASFVFEDWEQKITKGAFPKISSTKINNSLLNSVVGRIIFILFAILIYLLILGFSKIIGKNIAEEITIDGIKVASRIKRFMTWLIDVILIVPLIGYALIYFMTNNYTKSENLFTVFYSSQLLLFIFLYIIYYTLFEKIFGKTIGKFIFRTKVIAKSNYKKAGFGKILGRTLIRMIPFEPLSFLGKNPLGWHDKWSNTIVVYSNYKNNEKKYCKYCGNLISKNFGVCNNCNVQRTVESNSSFIKWIIIILGVIVGGFLLTIILAPLFFN